MHRAFASWSDNHKVCGFRYRPAVSARSARAAPARRRPPQDINFVEVTEECKAIGQDNEGCELAELWITALQKPELVIETYTETAPRTLTLTPPAPHLHPTTCSLAVRLTPRPHSRCQTTLALALARTVTSALPLRPRRAPSPLPPGSCRSLAAAAAPRPHSPRSLTLAAARHRE